MIVYGQISKPFRIPSPSISGSLTSPIPSPSVSASINKLNDSESAPAAFVAVTVNEVCVNDTVGVPEINPVAVFNVNPVGNVGAIEYVTIPPPEFTVWIEIGWLITPL